MLRLNGVFAFGCVIGGGIQHFVKFDETPANRVWAARTAATSQLLIGAGWRVATVPDGARLAAAWQELHRAGGAAMAFADGVTRRPRRAGRTVPTAPTTRAAAGVAGVADG